MNITIITIIYYGKLNYKYYKEVANAIISENKKKKKSQKKNK